MTATQKRAKVGGEIGANGEFYEGGKFIATKEDRAKRAPEPRKPSRGWEIDNRTFTQERPDGYLPLYRCLGGIHFQEGDQFRPNQTYLDCTARLYPDVADKFTEEQLANIAAWNQGKRWSRIPETSQNWREEFSALPEYK